MATTNYENTFWGAVDAIKKYYGENSKAWQEFSEKGVAAENAAQYLKNSGYDVITNENGEVLSYTYRGTAPITSTDTGLTVNSNLQTGTASSGNTVSFNTVQSIGTAAGAAGETVATVSKLRKYTNDVQGVLNTPVAGLLTPAVVAAEVGITLGKNIDSAIYNIGNALNLNPPESLDPDSWSSITADMSDTGLEGFEKRMFNSIFGIDDSGNVTTYIDEDAFAYFTRYLDKEGFFKESSYSYPDSSGGDTITIDSWIPASSMLGIFPGTVQWEDNSQQTYTDWLMDHGEKAGGLTYEIPWTKGDISGTASGGLIIHAWDAVKGSKHEIQKGSTKYPSWNITNPQISGQSLSLRAYGKDGIVHVVSCSTGGSSAFIGNHPNSYLPNTINVSGINATETQAVPGVNTITDATVPQFVDTDLASQTATLNALKLLYPQFWQNRVEQDVVQPDGSVKTHTYIPVSVPSGGNAGNVDTTGNTQPATADDTALKRGTSTSGSNATTGSTKTGTPTDTQIASVQKWITQPQTNPTTQYTTQTQTTTETQTETSTGTETKTETKTETQTETKPTGMVDPDPTTHTETETKTEPETPTAPKTTTTTTTKTTTETPKVTPTTPPPTNTDPNTPNTGSGDTPPVVVPEGTASSLYAVYNPTLAQVNEFGAWLWSSNFIDQILKLFSEPMQAIIGLHKIFATPATGAEQNIKVGYLDSGVSSKIVTSEYTTIDCGSVNLYEYFGNVFDYAPYTQIRLYLPFIGIVNLDTADAMRGTVSVVYHVDVLNGACLAEVRITRDGAGGTLYQYAGNAAVTMPVSSGSYIGVIANVVGVASSVVGGFASGGIPGAIAGGVTSALTRRGGTEVQHSGNFSGSAGAMGAKIPYLIIERPQTMLAAGYSDYIGKPANTTVTLNACSGYIKVTEVHLENIPATENELNDIERMLKTGVII